MRLTFLFTLLTFLGISALAVPVTRTASNGDWNTAATWSPLGVPNSDDNVIIPSGITVTITTDFINFIFPSAVNSVVINGTLVINNALFSMQSADVLTVNLGGQIMASGLGIISSGLTFFTTLDTPSPFPINGPAVMTSGALPITLLYFRGNQLGEEVVLEWASATEENFDHYRIERSADGFKFEDLTTVHGSGFSKEKKEYYISDLHPLPGKSYYRLFAVDLNGSSEQFDMISVEYDALEKRIYTWPNPTLRGNDFTMKANFRLTESDYLTIHNALGDVVLKTSLQDGSSFTVNTEKLGTGVHIINIQSPKHGRFTYKVILE